MILMSKILHPKIHMKDLSQEHLEFWDMLGANENSHESSTRSEIQGFLEAFTSND